MLTKINKTDNAALKVLTGISFGSILCSSIIANQNFISNLHTPTIITAHADQTDNTWGWPFDNFSNKDITSHFGWRNLWGHKQWHDGVDIANNSLNGKPIKCIHGGKVVQIGHEGHTQMDMGYYVVVESPDGYTTVYQEYSFYPSERNYTTVKVGQEVKTGDQIGTMHYSKDVTHIHIGLTNKGVSFHSAMKMWNKESNRWVDPIATIQAGINAQQAAKKPKTSSTAPTQPTKPSSTTSQSSSKPTTPTSNSISTQPTTPIQVHDTTNYANKVLSDPNIGSLQDIGFHKEHAGQSSYQVGNIYYHLYNNGAVIFGSTNPNDDLFTNPKFRSQWTNTEHPEAYIKDGNKVTNITWDAHHSAVDGHIDYNQQVEEHVLNNTPTMPSSSATSNSSTPVTPSSAVSSSTVSNSAVSNTSSSDVQSSSAVQSSATPSNTPSSAIQSSATPSNTPSSAIPSSSAVQPSSVSVTPSDVSSSATSSSATPQTQSSSSETNAVTSNVTNNVPNNASANNNSNNNAKATAPQTNGIAPNSNAPWGVLNNNLVQTNTANNKQNNGLALMMLGTSTLFIGIELNKIKLE